MLCLRRSILWVEVLFFRRPKAFLKSLQGVFRESKEKEGPEGNTLASAETKPASHRTFMGRARPRGKKNGVKKHKRAHGKFEIVFGEGFHLKLSKTNKYNA